MASSSDNQISVNRPHYVSSYGRVFSMQHKAIHTEAIDNGLDRQSLNQLQKRFLKINSGRLARTRSALSDRQQTFLDILPLLFHVNHPMLPGYVSRTAPAGICSFQPEQKDIDLGRSLARSFCLHRDPMVRLQIEGLYLMGSVGTLAHSDKSDFDIWVCYTPGLEPQAVAELNQKCGHIAAWAKSLRLDVHFFPMDYNAFKQGKSSTLDEESSGSAQHLLLLDEFYRTALHLAGRLPLWWFVPPAAEKGYQTFADTLLHRRFMSSSKVLDFGGISAIPSGEFLGAGIWQLYKAIESPYKSVLKLLLLEAYVGQQPQLEPLSLIYKQKIYDGQLDIDELDPYIMIYRRIEVYLAQQKQLRRLELARRCLYFKINKPLSKPFSGKQKSWQRKLLERLTLEWGWSNTYIQMLDERAHWKADRVIEERSILVNELNNSYRFLTEFATGCGAARAINNAELTVLGRKLQAAFERRPGKIEWINPRISGDISESHLVLTQVDNNRGSLWSAAPSVPHRAAPFKQCTTLVELLLWCYRNGIVDQATQLDLSATQIDTALMRRLLSSLQSWLPAANATMPHRSFETGAVPTHVLLLINVGQEAQSYLYDQGIQRTSNRTDALGYSGFNHNLVVSIDFVLRNSWQEISCRRFEGEHALLHSLEEYFSLSLPGSRQIPPQLTVDCVGANHTTAISQRVKEWFDDVTRCYYANSYYANHVYPDNVYPNNADSCTDGDNTDNSSDNSTDNSIDNNTDNRAFRPAATRYLFAMAGDFYSLQFKGPRLIIERHQDEATLLTWLGQEQTEYSPFVVDKRAFLKTPLRLISEHSQPQSICVFFHAIKGGMQLYLVDERGSFLAFTTPGHTLTPLHRFLRTINLRQVRSNTMNDTQPYPIHFFELYKDRRQELGCQIKKIPTEMRPGMMIDVKAVVSCNNNHDSKGNYTYNFYCDQEEFSQLQHGERIFATTANYIRSRRMATQTYPVYLTDLDLDLCRKQIAPQGQLQTNHYLLLKFKLEQELNNT